MTDEVIFGLDVSRIEADRLALKFIRKDWMEVERALITGKWFDYRFLSPVAATYLFAHEFKKIYRATYKLNVDSERGEHVKPLPEDLFKAPKNVVSGIWRARQVADAMGMPYNVYLGRAYHWSLRYWNHRHLPRPQQLYTDMITDRTAVDWEEIQGARLYYSALPGFKNPLYQSLKAQDDQHEWLFSQMARRGNSVEIVTRMIEEDLIPIEKLQARLDPEVCAGALASAQQNASLAL